MRSASAARPAAPSPQERPATADCRPTAPRRNRQAWTSALAAALFATSAACFFFGMQAQHAVQDAACALTLTGAGESRRPLARLRRLGVPAAVPDGAFLLRGRAAAPGVARRPHARRCAGPHGPCRTRGRLRLGRLRRPCRHGDVLRKLGSLRGLSSPRAGRTEPHGARRPRRRRPPCRSSSPPGKPSSRPACSRRWLEPPCSPWARLRPSLRRPGRSRGHMMEPGAPDTRVRATRRHGRKEHGLPRNDQALENVRACRCAGGGRPFPAGGARRLRGDHRPFRMRQVHHAAPGGRAGNPRRRNGSRGRARRHRPASVRTRRGHGLPGLRPVPASERLREHRLSPEGASHAPARGGGARARNGRAAGHRGAFGPQAFSASRVARSSAWPWGGPSCASRPCS